MEETQITESKIRLRNDLTTVIRAETPADEMNKNPIYLVSKNGSLEVWFDRCPRQGFERKFFLALAHVIGELFKMEVPDLCEEILWASTHWKLVSTLHLSISVYWPENDRAVVKILKDRMNVPLQTYAVFEQKLFQNKDMFFLFLPW